MGKMKEPLTDHVQCRVEKTSRRDHWAIGEFFLSRGVFDDVHLRHMSGEGFAISLSTFEAEVCPWEELGAKANVAELVAYFYIRHF